MVGTTVVEALNRTHEVTVIDRDVDRLNLLSYRYDILTVTGDGTNRSVLLEAGADSARLFIAATDSDEANIVAALIARPLGDARIVVRTHGTSYIDAWRAGHLDVDHMVSSEIETAQAIARALGLPTAVQTDTFADGAVELVEFVVDPAAAQMLIGRTIADAQVPDDCVIASIIRGDEVVIPGGADRIEAGDRLVLLTSHVAALEWARRLSRGAEQAVRDVVVVGGGRTGRSIASELRRSGFRVRLVERDPAIARRCAEEMPEVDVFCGDGTDTEFLKRERVGQADALITCTSRDSDDLLIALVGKGLGTRVTVSVVGDPAFLPVFEAAGVDVALNQRRVTAEEIVRFTHDPRARRLAILEDDRAEVIELEISPSSPMLGKPFRDRPLDGAIVGAIVRDGKVLYPRGNDSLRAGDRAIVCGATAKLRALEPLL